ncbi:MAG: peptidylprolyl isomerase [Culturomica sp.]|jgi:cyclophilin family peptidyl-prolyl cis-trans isomerase|nr:peptidylprolyl isomerase [Culturomica sp.]
MKRIIVLFLVFSLVGELQAKKYKDVVLETSLGNIKIELYDDTPKHSENFVKLVESGHYNEMLFHRVIKDFMIQSGSSDSRNAKKGVLLGRGQEITYTIPAEFKPNHLHVKGALAAARQGDQMNPTKASSGEQFYIVQGKKYTDEELDMFEANRLNVAKNNMARNLLQSRFAELQRYKDANNRAKSDSVIYSIQIQVEEHFADKEKRYTIPVDVRELYKTIGGTPFLDGEYTVYGMVVSGLDVVDKIAAQSTDANNRPAEDVKIIKAYTVNN